MLTNPTGGGVLDPVRSVAVLTILDDGGPADDGGTDDNGGGAQGVLKFDEASFEIIEGQLNAVVRVERSRGETGAVSVTYIDRCRQRDRRVSTTRRRRAPCPGPPATARPRQFTIPILEDALDEGNETISLRLSNPTGGARLDADRDTAVVNILDNDASTTACAPGGSTGCAQGNRFAFEVTYRAANGLTGRGTVVPQAGGNSAIIWFFSPDNAEILVKVLDACGFTASPAYWVFFAATTNVDFTLRVTDTHTGSDEGVPQPSRPGGAAGAGHSRPSRPAAS